MRMLLLRKQRTAISTTGELFIDDRFECYAIERPLESMKGAQAPFAIPSGTYKVGFYKSPHLGYTVPLLQNVPGRDFIEIHVANYSTDVRGCIGVGDTIGTDYVGMSKIAFERLMRKLGGENDLSIVVRED